MKNRFLTLIKEKPLMVILSSLCYVAMLVVFIFAISELNLRLQFELSEIASCDANLFFTVGKGMAKGYRTYLDYYENKPPMIFIISALSYSMTGGFYLVNVASFLCCINLLVAPIGIGIVITIKRKWNMFSTALVIAILFTSSLFFVFYSEQRSGEIMCEIFGVSALMDTLFCLVFLSEEKKIHFYNPLIIIAGIFFGIAIMFKEPFVLLGFFALLFLVRNKKDLLYKVLLPCGYALITVFIILLASNSLIGYFSVYLPNMLGNHINTNGTLFDRMKDFRKLLDDLNGFSKYLMVAVVITIYVSAIRGALLFDDEEKIYWKIIFKVIRIILPFIYLYIASLCVGMGGQYFWHHFAFAMPLYYVAMIDSCALIGEGANKINFYPFKKGNGKPTLEEFARPHSLLALMVSAALLFYLGYGIEKHECHMKTEEMKAYVVKAKEHAKYIDSVLDAINKDNYLFIGFNGTDRPYCYTKHMPLGPIFAQDPDNFKEDNFFTRSFLEDLHTADVIVFTSCDSLSIKDEISNYLANNFANTLPTAAEGIEKPSSFYYQLYFRN